MILTAHGQTHIPITRERAQFFAQFAELCREYNWMPMIVCETCQKAFGVGKDGVEANNSTDTSEFIIQCGHQRLSYHAGINHG